MKLTSKERIMRIFQNKEVDRPALKMWGAALEQKLLHPDYKIVCDLAAQNSDLFELASSNLDPFSGEYPGDRISIETCDTSDPLWQEERIIYRTPEGDLETINQVSTVGEPSYIKKHVIQEPEDIDKILSMPYKPVQFDFNNYYEKAARLGDRGVVLIAMLHPGCTIHYLMGSETMAYFSLDYRDKLHELINLYSRRIRDYTKTILDAGIKAPFHWVGPEVFIPPLMSPRDFEDFVFQYDKPLCDDIHNAGGHVWVHCHGKVADFIGRFIDMGIDVINPLEPPPNGNIDMDAIIEKYGNRIGWEGNIEIQNIIQSEPQMLKELIHECVHSGNKSGRFVLCPSAGFMEYPFPSKQYIDNLMLYLQYGFECVESCRK